MQPLWSEIHPGLSSLGTRHQPCYAVTVICLINIPSTEIPQTGRTYGARKKVIPHLLRPRLFPFSSDVRSVVLTPHGHINRHYLRTKYQWTNDDKAVAICAQHFLFDATCIYAVHFAELLFIFKYHLCESSLRTVFVLKPQSRFTGTMVFMAVHSKMKHGSDTRACFPCSWSSGRERLGCVATLCQVLFFVEPPIQSLSPMKSRLQINASCNKRKKLQWFIYCEKNTGNHISTSFIAFGDII